MTGVTLAALIRYYTKTNSTTFTDADILPLVNIFKDEIATKIVEKDAGYFIIPTTFNLVANQREYGMPDDLLSRMHKLEVKFTSTSSRFKAKFLKNYNGSETESEIVKNFSNSDGGFAYVIRRRAIYLLSGTIISVTDGGRLWYLAYPADLANLSGTTDLSIDPSTTTFGFPRQFHELLARRVSIAYKGSLPKPLPLNAIELNYERDLETQLNSLTTLDESAELIGDSLSSLETGSDGFDY